MKEEPKPIVWHILGLMLTIAVGIACWIGKCAANTKDYDPRHGAFTFGLGVSAIVALVIIQEVVSNILYNRRLRKKKKE